MQEINMNKKDTRVFKIAKQMLKERVDIVGNIRCLKDATGNLVVNDNAEKDVWKCYMEKLMNEVNQWDYEVTIDTKEERTSS